MSLLALSRFVHSALVAGSVTLRDPHSFPTRRSSDLGFHKGILEFIKPYECRPQWVVCCLVLTHANPLDHDCYRHGDHASSNKHQTRKQPGQTKTNGIEKNDTSAQN